MITIAVIGAGQLGSRHLQALALLKKPANIQVIDVSQASLETAKKRFEEVNKNFTGTISFHTDITSLDKNIEIAIVATGSKIRRQLIEQLLSHSTVKYIILEKFLFTKKEDYTSIEKLLIQKNIKAWVNCPRRMMSFYQKLSKEIKGPVHFMATGNAWGMGCNGIHMLDLFSYLTNTTDIILSNKLIAKKTEQSKREGYIEFTGIITGQTNNDSFHITSFPTGTSPLHIIINTPTVRYSIEEGANAKVWISRLDNNWKWEEDTFTMPFQSGLTNIVVEELLNTGNCSLTAYKESSTLHLIYLNTLIAFLKEVNNDNSIEECLIT